MFTRTIMAKLFLKQAIQTARDHIRTIHLSNVAILLYRFLSCWCLETFFGLYQPCSLLSSYIFFGWSYLLQILRWQRFIVCGPLQFVSLIYEFHSDCIDLLRSDHVCCVFKTWYLPCVVWMSRLALSSHIYFLLFETPFMILRLLAPRNTRCVNACFGAQVSSKCGT